MEKKIIIILEIMFVLVAIGFYFFKELIPEYKTKFGSSDAFINPNKYESMVEINVDGNVSFAIVLDNNKDIYHLLFLNERSVCLYNKNIEKTSLDNGLLTIVKKLIENDYLRQDSIIQVTRYEEKYYSDFMKSFKSVLDKYSINTDILEKTSTIKDRALELGISGDNDSNILINIDYFSKELCRANKGNNSFESLSDVNCRKYTDNIYKKLEKYVSSNNIVTLEKGNTELLISLIPADNNGNYYPSSNSWYYVKNSKVYAYIELVSDQKSCSFCYNGSIDTISKGECE